MTTKNKKIPQKLEHGKKKILYIKDNVVYWLINTKSGEKVVKEELKTFKGVRS